jgi:hypothetical protein
MSPLPKNKGKRKAKVTTLEKKLYGLPPEEIELMASAQRLDAFPPVDDNNENHYETLLRQEVYDSRNNEVGTNEDETISLTAVNVMKRQLSSLGQELSESVSTGKKKSSQGGVTRLGLRRGFSSDKLTCLIGQ